MAAAGHAPIKHEGYNEDKFTIEIDISDRELLKRNINNFYLKESMELVSELNLNNRDHKRIFKKFKKIFENSELMEKLHIINSKIAFNEKSEFKEIMLEIVTKIDIDELIPFLEYIFRKDDLIYFIQDLFNAKYMK
ncbi:MAG: hypothetical protein EU529_05690 [Promethearchaeota archaeon]|nr:MAG: hypothetical protein EU529_05690 [Candidatus Lokiarchaeota archaeon]